MALAYISPSQMEQYKKTLSLFAGHALSTRCIRSHYFDEATGNCDLTKEKEIKEIFVLANNSNKTLKVSKKALDIVANVLEIEELQEAFDSLKAQKRQFKEKILNLEEEKKALSQKRRVILRKKS